MKKFLLILSFLLLSHGVYSQCTSGAGTDAGAITPTAAFQTVAAPATQAYFTFNGVAGATYTFTFCSNGGGVSYDSYLTIVDGATGTTAFAQNDDACGLSSEIIWVCPANGSYRIFITSCCPCGGVASGSTLAYNATGLPEVVPYSGNTSITTCSGTIQDHGGSGNYADFANGYTVINPSIPGNVVRLTFTEFNTETNFDYVTIYDGVGTGGTVLYGPQSGNPALPTVTSLSGPITILFTSDVSIQGSGFTANISCIVPPLANDDCVNAIGLSCGSVVSGSTTTATADAIPVCGGSPGAVGVWYSFVGNGGMMTANTCAGASYDTRLAVYSGTCGGLTCVVENDDACGAQSSVSFMSTLGTTYYIFVNGFAGQTGTFTLSLIDSEAPVFAPCSSDMNVNNDLGVCGAVVTFASPTATDNCGVPVVTQTAGLPSGSTFPLGSSPVTFTATDAVGNIATCTFNVIVSDTEAPVINCPSGSGSAAMFTSTVEPNPWGQTGHRTGMNTAFGAGLWGDFNYETTPAATVFNPTYGFVYMEGGNNSTSELLAYLTTNQVLIENWVTAGGSLLINYGSNEVMGSTNVGFGGTTFEASNTSTGTESVPGHPIFNGPLTPATGPFTGSSFNHHRIANGGTTIITDGAGFPALTEKAFGSGVVMFGGMPTPFIGSGFGWNPVPNHDNMFANLLTYLGSLGSGSISVPATAGQCGAIVNYTDPTYTDNCPGVTLITVPPSGSFFPVGVTTVTATATDANGLTSTCTFDVTVVDTEAPVPNSPATISGTFTSVAVPVAIPDVAQTIVPVVVSGLPTSLNSGDLTSVCINLTHTFDGDIQIRLQSPLGTLYDLSINNGGGGDDYTNTCFDMSAGTPITAGSAPFSGSFIPQGAAGFDVFNGENPNGTWNLVIDDVVGGDAGTAFGFVMNFLIPGGLADITAECDATPTTPTATDNCAGTITGVPDVTFPITAQGTTVVTWTYDDGNGNISTETQNIILDDITAPVIACPATIAVSNDLATCGAVVNYSLPVVTDNCPSPNADILVNGNFESGVTGPWVISSNVVDGGNGSCEENWELDINSNSTCCCVTDFVALGGNYSAFTSFDGGGAPTYYMLSQSFTVPAGLTLADLSFNYQGEFSYTGASRDLLVEFYDATNTVLIGSVAVIPMPTGTIPLTNYNSSVLGVLAGQIGNTVNLRITAVAPDAFVGPSKFGIDDISLMTNGGPSLTQTAGLPSGSTFPVGTTTNTFVATDASGNTSNCSFDVTVTDDEAPVFTTCYADTTAPAVAGLCGRVITYTLPSAYTDNCGVVSIAQTDGTGLSSGQIFPVGTTTQSFTIMDAVGNAATCSFDIIIVDDQDPVITGCPATDVTANSSANGCDAIVTWASPVASDNCPGVTMVSSHSPGSVFPIGTTVVTYTATDVNTNTTTCTFNVVVSDITAPIADVANLDITSACVPVTATAPTATDNCAGSVTGTTADPLTYSTPGSYTITWTYDDGNGNTVTQTQSITVDADVAPVADVANIDVTSECGPITVTAPTATDNCAGAITGTTTDPLTYTTQGTFTVTWTYDDGNGNTSTQAQTVTVDDVTAPVTSAIADATGSCTVTVATTPTATDACAGVITGTTTDALTYNAAGTYVITWTFDDGNGNVSSATQNVIVTDNTAPVPDVALLANVTGNCTVTVSTTPTATDACEGVITGTTTDLLVYNVPGTYFITWTYNDGNGNIFTQNQTVIVDPCLGINEAGEEIAVNLYPNPSNGIFNLSLSSMPQGRVQIKLLDELGQVLYINELQSLTQSYDFSYLRAATYYVQIISNDVHITKTIIITKQY